MNELFLPAAGCLMLGIMTTIHPCPMTANIAAISLLSGTSPSRKKQISIIANFSLGYMFALVGIGVFINFGLISIPKLSVYLQSVLSAFLGPMLIVVGMALTGMINLNRPFRGMLLKKEYWRDKSSIYILPMGALLALAFCPATAFIYFGIMIPLSVNHSQIIMFPLLYAAGALIPITIISILINQGFVVALKQKWVKIMPRIAGWILILSGIYITLEQLYF